MLFNGMNIFSISLFRLFVVVIYIVQFITHSLICVLTLDNEDGYLGQPASWLQSSCVSGEYAGRVDGRGVGDKSSASLILTWWQAGLALKCQGDLAWEAEVALSAAGGEGHQLWSVPGDNETEKSWNGQSNCKSFTVHLINLETQSGVSTRAGCCMVLTNCTVP
jgi:hypothetical protein